MIYEIVFRLILLHGPGNQQIWVNPETITSVRVPLDKDHLANGVRCVVNMGDGKFATVLEDCETVKEMGELK